MSTLLTALALVLAQSAEAPLPEPPLVSASGAAPAVRAEPTPRSEHSDEAHFRLWTLGTVTTPSSLLEGTWQAGVRAGLEVDRLAVELSAERGGAVLALLTAADAWRGTVGWALVSDAHLRLFVLAGAGATVAAGSTSVSGLAPLLGVKGRVGFDLLSLEARAAATTAGGLDGSAEVVVRLGFLAVQGGLRAQVGGVVGSGMVVSPTVSLGLVI